MIVVMVAGPGETRCRALKCLNMAPSLSAGARRADSRLLQASSSGVGQGFFVGVWIAPGLMEAVMTGRITAMGQRKYSLELRERATRMALEARADPDRSRGAVRRIAEELGIHPEALRTWVRQAEIDRGDRPGTTTDEARRIKELEKEVRELRRANEILRKASAYFAQAELDRR